MKILLVAPQPFYQERGTPIAVRLLAETLCDFGHEVDLLVYHDGADITVPGMRLLRAGRPPGIGAVPIGISWQKLVCDVWLVTRMVQQLFRERYDVVHAVEEAVFPAAVFNLFSKRKLIYDMDSSLSDQLTDKWRVLRPLRGFLSLFERGAVMRSSAVLAVCEDLAAKVRPWKPDARSVIVLPDVPLPDVPTGGDAQPGGEIDSLRARVGQDSVLCLYVGNLEKYQGIDLLVEGMARLHPDLDLHMVVIGGRSDHVAHYTARAQALGIAGRMHFLGARPVSHLNAYLAQADVLVSPRTLGQNTPMKVYSYMQSGKAILATNIRSHTQALDADCAELVAPEAEAMAEGLSRLARDLVRRQALGVAARAKAEREYSLPVFREKLRAAYQRVAEG